MKFNTVFIMIFQNEDCSEAESQDIFRIHCVTNILLLEKDELVCSKIEYVLKTAKPLKSKA